LSLTAKPLSGTSSHDTGDFYTTLGSGKSALIMWNNISVNRYDWLAVKYLGSGRFATLDRFGKSINLNNGQTMIRNYSSGGSTITLKLSNPTGSG
jgi:hypothetical protein